MKIELNIEATVQAAVEAALAEDRLRSIITSEVTKTVDSVIKDQFQRYGDFTKKVIEPAIRGMLPHELRLEDGAQWEHYVKTVIQQRVAAYNNERFNQALAPLLDNLLERPPAHIKLSELVAKAVEHWKDHYSRDSSDEQPTVIVQRNYPSPDGIWIRMDPEEDKDRNSCRVSFGVTTTAGKTTIYGLRVDGDEIAKNRFAGPAYGFEAYLLALHTNGSTIEIDQEDFSDVYYPGAND